MRLALGPTARFFTVALLAAVVAAGCGSKGKAKLPAKLVRIDHPQIQGVNVWTEGVGNGGGKFYSNLRVALGEDAVYAAAENGRVMALQPSKGKVLWKTLIKGRLISGPTLNGDAILIGTLDGEVIALRRTDGKPLWRVKGPSEALAPPVGAGDIVVAKGVDGRTYGLDAATGERKWSFDRNEPNLTLRGMSAPLVLGKHIYIGLDNGKLVCLNLEDGALVWEETISVPTGRGALDQLTDIDADLLPTPDGDGLYVVSYGGDLSRIDLGSGDARWHRSIKSYTGMALGGDKLYVTDDDGTVWALDAETGAAAWKQQDLKYRHLSPPGYLKGYVVVADFQGYVHWLSADDGKIVGRSRLGSGPITAPMVTDDGLLYMMNTGGLLRAFDLKPAK